MLVSGGVWGLFKAAHRLIVSSVTRELQELRSTASTITEIKREVTPNGKDTHRLGDTAARTEAKVDALHELLLRYIDKTDEIRSDLDRLLGQLDNS